MKKMQKLFQAINSGKYKYTKFNQFLNYLTHNKSEIKRSPPQKQWKQKELSETETWKIMSWQKILS